MDWWGKLIALWFSFFYYEKGLHVKICVRYCVVFILASHDNYLTTYRLELRLGLNIPQQVVSRMVNLLASLRVTILIYFSLVILKIPTIKQPKDYFKPITSVK